MRDFRNGLVAAGALLAISSVNAGATTFDFTYTFNTSQVITGSFTGTAVPIAGGYFDVTNPQNITASLDGTAFHGPLNDWFYTGAGTDCPTCWSNGGAVVSSNPADNNFLFVDNTPSGSLSGYSNYFYIIPWPNGANNPVATQLYSNRVTLPDSGMDRGAPCSDCFVNYYNGQFVPGNWSLTATPLPATWTMMLIGLAGLGFCAYRRSNKVALPVAA